MYVIGFFTLSTMPGKLVSLLLDPMSSAECKSTYRMFVLAGNSACKLITMQEVDYGEDNKYYCTLKQIQNNMAVIKLE